ncbi:hypothetical protein OWR29_05360 [Actinoplanes sp. Pm04-4]|uniref:Uncharacterized protein n=1 Tax=Paractinoplanes pyxinae TaxID=2997416 RepID=A0ABT4AT54_9ACTN|nr:hypothetical protein [Actinoplanes pyxinae]MCY1137420.1 hypothetical protein [Actinoplanes pyxinae]
MDDLPDRLDQAADALTALSRDVPALAVAPGAFSAPPPLAAAGGPGLPARLGGALHDHWTAVLDARASEASAAAARLAELSRSVRITRQQYAETDEAVERRFQREV